MKKTALYNQCVSLGAKMVEFSSWSLPLQFSSIINEHKAVRENIGLFDCSHMGQILLKGVDSYKAVNHLISNNLDKISQGKALYTGILNEQGKFLDDVIVYFVNSQEFLFIVNAINTNKIFSWIQEKVQEFHWNLCLKNISSFFSLLALQGRNAPQLINKLFCKIYDKLNPFSFCHLSYLGKELMISRTGYTGEEGVEFLVPNEQAESLFSLLIVEGALPCGLGARDSLRVEKGYSLYGQEISENISPLESGLEWICDFKKNDFIGKSALLKERKEGVKRKFVAFKSDSRPIARYGDEFVNDEENIIGIVTSGVVSPSLSQGIGMGLIDARFKGNKLRIKTKRKIILANRTNRNFISQL